VCTCGLAYAELQKKVDGVADDRTSMPTTPLPKPGHHKGVLVERLQNNATMQLARQDHFVESLRTFFAVA
jgi:hypothetical protein